MITFIGLVIVLFFELVVAIFNPVFSSGMANGLWAYLFLSIHGLIFLMTIIGYVYLIFLIWKK